MRNMMPMDLLDREEPRHKYDVPPTMGKKNCLRCARGIQSWEGCVCIYNLGHYINDPIVEAILCDKFKEEKEEEDSYVFR